ncbi:MAG: hypothetical protein JRJ29_04490 [Deltaproteobacteria bacterium]|nr:hypothetical protein [Deltaproteobacteria bacterium]
MPYYIVCNRKRNNPRMDVRICKSKCPDKEQCKAFKVFTKILVPKETQALPQEHSPSAARAS